MASELKVLETTCAMCGGSGHAQVCEYVGPERRRDIARRDLLAGKSRAELMALLMTDELTGLANRRAFVEHWDLEARMGGDDILFALFDVDSLKWVNDALGHEAGDSLLRAAGLALAGLGARLRTDRDVVKGAQAYRLGGDEFVLVVELQEGAAKGSTSAQIVREVSNCTLSFTWLDAASVRWSAQGLTLTVGVGSSLQTADDVLRRNKGAREGAGRRAPRGERPADVKLARIATEILPTGGEAAGAQAGHAEGRKRGQRGQRGR